MRRPGAILAILASALSACSASGERTSVSVGYYAIKGDSFEALDQQIGLHGPNVEGAGRALAATTVRMIPNFRFGYESGACRVLEARVTVNAHVLLPKLASPEALKQALSRAWDNLEQYARLHESVHVSIADRHAAQAEKAILALPPEADCSSLRANAAQAFRREMAEHQRDQLQFDEDERGRIADLMRRTREQDG